MSYDKSLWSVGQRVQSHPATDAFMSGDRFGVIVRLGAKRIHVKMDRSGKVIKLHPCNVLWMKP